MPLPRAMCIKSTMALKAERVTIKLQGKIIFPFSDADKIIQEYFITHVHLLQLFSVPELAQEIARD